MSDIDGPTFVRILKALEKYSSMIPPQQLAMLRSQETLQIFESTKPMNLLAMVMPDDNKIILTLGRKSFDMSMFVKKVGSLGRWRHRLSQVRGSSRLRPGHHLLHVPGPAHRTGQGSEVAARLGLSTAPLPTFLTSLTSSTVPP